MDATTALRAELPRLFKKLGVTSLLDAPCGDAGWINSMNLRVRLIGVDIVSSLIERLQDREAREKSKANPFSPITSLTYGLLRFARNDAATEYSRQQPG